MLLAQIKSNYSSGGDSSSDDGGNEDDKSSKKVKKQEEEEEEEEDDEAEQQGIKIFCGFFGRPSRFRPEPICVCFRSRSVGIFGL